MNRPRYDDRRGDRDRRWGRDRDFRRGDNNNNNNNNNRDRDNFRDNRDRDRDFERKQPMFTKAGKERERLSDKELEKLRAGMAAGLVKCLVESSFLEPPNTCVLPKVWTQLSGGDGSTRNTLLGKVPSEDLIPLKENAAGVDWRSTSYSLDGWTTHFLLDNKRIGAVCGKFLEAPPAAILKLPAALNFEKSVPAACLPSIVKAAGMGFQIELTSLETSKHIDEWLMDPMQALGEIPYVNVPEAVMFLVKKDDKFYFYVITEEAFKTEVNTPGKKPHLLVGMEVTMLTLCSEEEGAAEEGKHDAGWLCKDASQQGHSIEGYPGIKAVPRQGISDMLRIVSTQYDVTVVTTAKHDFAEAALRSINITGIDIVSLHDRAEYIAENDGGKKVAKDINLFSRGYTSEAPVVIADVLRKMWPSDQHAHMLPGSNPSTWTSVLTSIAEPVEGKQMTDLIAEQKK